MNLIAALFKTSIGRKILMAVTGLLLVAWVTGHLFGNLHLFGSPDEINGYAHFLQSLGPVLWIERAVLLLLVVLHIWAAYVLTLENMRARPENYTARHTIQATLASRTMRWTGAIVLFFLLYHLAHFTIGVRGAFFEGQYFKGRIAPYVMQHDFHLLGFLLVKAGTTVDDVFTMVVQGFQNPIVAGFYIIAVGLLSFHLWHGIESMFQTLGLRTRRWSGFLSGVARLFCVAYFAGNLLIVGSVLAGYVRPLDGSTPGQPEAHASVHD